MPQKSIKLIRTFTEFINQPKRAILEHLMSKVNSDASKDVAVDVGSNTEEITNKRLSPKKYVYTLLKDQYDVDKEDMSPLRRSHLVKSNGIEKSGEIKNLIGVEYS